MLTPLRASALWAALGVGAALAACSSVGPAPGNPLMVQEDLAALRRAAPPTATTFSGALAGEYLALAEAQARQYEWGTSDRFARKGLVAARGGVIAPDETATRNLPPERAAELQAAYVRLIAALND